MANIDVTTVIGRSGAGPQVTMKEKITATSDLKTLVFEAIPNQISWGQIARISVPGGGIMTRANFFPLWRRMVLKFDCGLGATPGDAFYNVISISMNALNFLHAIESISITVDQQLVHTVSGGAQGALAQKYIDAVVKRMPEDASDGTSAFQYIYNLARQDVDPVEPKDKFTSYDDAIDGNLCMILSRGLDLSLLFDGLFTEADPRMFGNELSVEILMADMPPTINGMHGSLFVYGTDSACNGLQDTRSLFHLANLRVEI